MKALISGAKQAEVRKSTLAQLQQLHGSTQVEFLLYARSRFFFFHRTLSICSHACDWRAILCV
jgi:hypothetical protein